MFLYLRLQDYKTFWWTSKLLSLLVLLSSKINAEVLPMHYTYRYTIELYSSKSHNSY